MINSSFNIKETKIQRKIWIYSVCHSGRWPKSASTGMAAPWYCPLSQVVTVTCSSPATHQITQPHSLLCPSFLNTPHRSEVTSPPEIISPPTPPVSSALVSFLPFNCPLQYFTHHSPWQWVWILAPLFLFSTAAIILNFIPTLPHSHDKSNSFAVASLSGMC